MTIPVWVLLMFAMWTLMALIGSVGFYRWREIFTGRSQVKDFRSDDVQGHDWYRRAMRAHANNVENLPVYGAIVVVLLATGIERPLLDYAAITLITARILQTLTHIIFTPTNTFVLLRFVFFLVQVFCMVSMASLIVGVVV